MFKSFKKIGRTGTKIVLAYLVFVCLMIVGLLFVVPFVPALQKFYEGRDLSTILGVLAGPGGLMVIMNEIRKAVEKKAGQGAGPGPGALEPGPHPDAE